MAGARTTSQMGMYVRLLFGFCAHLRALRILNVDALQKHHDRGGRDGITRATESEVRSDLEECDGLLH